MTHWAYTDKREKVIQKVSKGWKNLEKRPFKKLGKQVLCLNCGHEFYAPQCQLVKGKGKYCSRKCGNESRKGKIPLNLKYAQSKSPIQKGHKAFVKYGENHWAWQGDKPSYSAVHAWLNKKYGKAQKCEKCGSTKSVQWANKDGKYMRDINNFMQLCASCHKLYDLKVLY